MTTTIATNTREARERPARPVRSKLSWITLSTVARAVPGCFVVRNVHVVRPPFRESDCCAHCDECRDGEDRPKATALWRKRAAAHLATVFSGTHDLPGGRGAAGPEPRAMLLRPTRIAALAALLFGCFCRPTMAAATTVVATPENVAVYASVLHHINPQLPRWQSRELAQRVLSNAERWRLDANM